MAYPVPDFDDLPKVDGMPKGCAWGLFDRNGEKDQLGTLNFLTPEVVKAAAQEVRDGVSISLKLDPRPPPPSFKLKITLGEKGGLTS